MAGEPLSELTDPDSWALACYTLLQAARGRILRTSANPRLTSILETLETLQDFVRSRLSVCTRFRPCTPRVFSYNPRNRKARLKWRVYGGRIHGFSRRSGYSGFVRDLQRRAPLPTGYNDQDCPGSLRRCCGRSSGKEASRQATEGSSNHERSSSSEEEGQERLVQPPKGRARQDAQGRYDCQGHWSEVRSLHGDGQPPHEAVRAHQVEEGQGSEEEVVLEARGLVERRYTGKPVANLRAFFFDAGLGLCILLPVVILTLDRSVPISKAFSIGVAQSRASGQPQDGEEVGQNPSK